MDRARKAATSQSYPYAAQMASRNMAVEVPPSFLVGSGCWYPVSEVGKLKLAELSARPAAEVTGTVPLVYRKSLARIAPLSVQVLPDRVDHCHPAVVPGPRL